MDLRSYFREKGFAETISYALLTMHEKWYRARCGVKDTRAEKLTDFGPFDSSCYDYSSTSMYELKKFFHHLPLASGNEVFLDYGAGKGATMRFAAEFPFKRIIGIEIVPQLAAIGNELFAGQKKKMRCKDCSIHVGNAVDFEVPDDVTVAYLYNPFSPETTARAIERVEQSFSRNNRTIHLLFKSMPYCRELRLEDRGWHLAAEPKCLHNQWGGIYVKRYQAGWAG